MKTLTPVFTVELAYRIFGLRITVCTGSSVKNVVFKTPREEERPENSDSIKHPSLHASHPVMAQVVRRLTVMEGVV